MVRSIYKSLPNAKNENGRAVALKYALLHACIFVCVCVWCVCSSDVALLNKKYLPALYLPALVARAGRRCGASVAAAATKSVENVKVTHQSALTK